MNDIKLIYNGGADTWDLSPYGRTFRERNEFVNMREERAASGKLRRDLQTIKKVFTFPYDAIDGAEVDILERLLYDHAAEVMRLELYDGDATTPRVYDVLMSAYERERLPTLASPLWSGVTVELVEV